MPLGSIFFTTMYLIFGINMIYNKFVLKMFNIINISNINKSYLKIMHSLMDISISLWVFFLSKAIYLKHQIDESLFLITIH